MGIYIDTNNRDRNNYFAVTLDKELGNQVVRYLLEHFVESIVETEVYILETEVLKSAQTI